MYGHEVHATDVPSITSFTGMHACHACKASKACRLTPATRPPTPAPAALRAVVPAAGPPGTKVSLFGSSTWYLQNDCKAANWGDATCVGAVLFGDYMCRTEQGDVSSVIEFNNFARYGWGQYRLNCTLPAPAGGNGQVGTPERDSVAVFFGGGQRAGGGKHGLGGAGQIRPQAC